MPAQPTKVYPLSTNYLMGVPHVTTEVATKKEADDLIATGAFTDNPQHPDRLREEGAEAPAAPAAPEPIPSEE